MSEPHTGETAPLSTAPARDVVRIATSAPRIQLGTDYQPPSRVDLPVDSSIAFYHPGYEPPFNLLFSLPRVERTGSGDSEQWGVHYTTALTACQIIANNAFDGYLAAQADGARLEDDADSILLHTEYFFIVPSATDHPYAVVPSFQEWKFPGTASIPRIWKDAARRANTSAWGASSGGRCVVTGRFLAESAHLSPKEDKEWFSQNVMAQYDPHSSNNVDCTNNIIPLDCSLHRAMDKRIWAFAPRHGRFAIQTISIPQPLTYDHLCEFVHEFHGRHMANQGRVEFLFARFAWAVIYLIKTFVLMPRRKTWLARYRLWEDDGDVRQEEQDLTPKEIDKLFGGGGTKSASPRATRGSGSRKRSRPTSEQGRDAGAEISHRFTWEDLPWKFAWAGSDWNHDLARCDEIRGRRETREEEDDIRFGKRRRGYTSRSSPPGSMPSLANTDSLSGASVSPSPGTWTEK